MEYHDNFWLAVGAAAPVIALAAIVAMSDTKEYGLRWYFEAQNAIINSAKLPVDKWGLISAAFKEREHQARFTKLVLPLVFGNLILQTLAFAAALFSLAWQADKLPPIIIAVVQIVGLALLAAVTAILNYAKYHLVKLKRHARFLEYYRNKESSDAAANDGHDVVDTEQLDR